MVVFTPYFAFAIPLKVGLSDESRIEHDEGGDSVVINKGTDSDVCTSGVSSGFPCKNVELLARMPLASIGGGSGSDSWGWKDSENGRYYVIMARSTGTSFIDVTNPESPVYLGNLPTTSGDEPWRDVKVYADHAFIVADGIPDHGMQVFDLTRLRGVVSPQQFNLDALYSGVGPAHNIAINEDTGFAYIVGSNDCAGGLHMVDIRNPKSPTFAGCYANDGYTHDVQCLTYTGPDQDHQGAEICFGSNGETFSIVDVSDKNVPVRLGKIFTYPQRSFVHQGWLNKDQAVFFLGDEADERNFGSNTRTLMIDVNDLDNPVFMGAHLHSTSVIDHNMYVKGNYLYQANYLGGLRVLQIDQSQGTSLTEVGYFDTVPEADSKTFDGAWNVYPFFDNDTIVVSDVSNGLFILRASLPDDNATSAPLNGQISGIWTSEGLNDQGLTLTIGENDEGPFVFFAWFIYLEGEPFWLVGNTGFEYGDDEVVIPTQKLSGLEFLTTGTDSANREDIGTVKIHVHSCNDIHVEYNFAGLGSDELDFQQLAAVQGRECTD